MNKKDTLIIVFDVDGVLTTGQFFYSKEGKEYKVFGAHDNDGIKMLAEHYPLLFITADKRGFGITQKRITDMKHELLLLSEGDRYRYLDETYDLKNVIYIGDGYHDAPILKDCLLGIAPANARIEARQAADYVTPSASGEGAVLDASLYILNCLKTKTSFTAERRFDSDTLKFVSIASKPSQFGINFHNMGYSQLGVNAVYMPLMVAPSELRSLISLIRSNFSGASVSMPHKQDVLPLLDEIDPLAEKIGAVNTIVNKAGILKGYNTDYYGALKVIRDTVDIEGKEVVILGAGGVARAIAYAVIELGGCLTVLNRTRDRADDLAKELNVASASWDSRHKMNGTLLINATSIGMGAENQESPFDEDWQVPFDGVMDVIVGNNTSLIKHAKKFSRLTIRGQFMALYQAVKQFELYTDKAYPEALISTFL